MERFVICYNVGDGYTFGYEKVLPIEYESIEAFYVDFTESARQAYMDQKDVFCVGDYVFDTSDFIDPGLKASELSRSREMIWENYNLLDYVDFQTLDKWFETENSHKSTQKFGF